MSVSLQTIGSGMGMSTNISMKNLVSDSHLNIYSKAKPIHVNTADPIADFSSYYYGLTILPQAYNYFKSLEGITSTTWTYDTGSPYRMSDYQNYVTTSYPCFDSGSTLFFPMGKMYIDKATDASKWTTQLTLYLTAEGLSEEYYGNVTLSSFSGLEPDLYLQHPGIVAFDSKTYESWVYTVNEYCADLGSSTATLSIPHPTDFNSSTQIYVAPILCNNTTNENWMLIDELDTYLTRYISFNACSIKLTFS